MAKVVQFRSRHMARPVSGWSFARRVVLGMVASFLVGASATYFMSDSGAGEQGSRPKGSDIPSYRAAEEASLSARSQTVTFRQCRGSVRVNCIVDGDTLWTNGIKLRIADIDAPEIGQPSCASEKVLGDRAMIRLLELVNAGPFETVSWPGRDEDKYGRKLRILMRDGRSLGDILVSEGLARTWTGKRQPWC
ncbi:thermonuclease family protein [Rhizobium sp. GR12]|uniref:thermonuclease family protein n=1 Tax=Rhizobium sp. GR12 TaxID=3053925 RepID=UPI002FBD6202